MSKKNTTKINAVIKKKCTCDVNQDMCKLHCKLKLKAKCKHKSILHTSSSSSIVVNEGAMDFTKKNKKNPTKTILKGASKGKKGILKDQSLYDLKKERGRTCKQEQNSSDRILENYNITKDLIREQNKTYNDGIMRYGFDRQKLPAILSLQPKVKTDESTPETRLWRAVVMQAMFDIASVAKRGSCKAAKFSAEQWIDLSNPNFILVCRLALLDPVLVYNRARSVVSLRDLELFFKNC